MEEKIISSVLYVTASKNLEEQVEEELNKIDPLQESAASVIENLEIVDENA
jgi:hypothetical protein